MTYGVEKKPMTIRINICGDATKSIKCKKNNINYVTKDVKLTIRHNSWLVDAKLSLETILEMAYLWSQAFSLNEIIHEMKISNKTAIEWCTFFRVLYKPNN